MRKEDEEEQKEDGSEIGQVMSHSARVINMANTARPGETNGVIKMRTTERERTCQLDEGVYEGARDFVKEDRGVVCCECWKGCIGGRRSFRVVFFFLLFSFFLSLSLYLSLSSSSGSAGLVRYIAQKILCSPDFLIVTLLVCFRRFRLSRLFFGFQIFVLSSLVLLPVKTTSVDRLVLVQQGGTTTIPMSAVY